MNALVSLNLFDADLGVSGRGQAHSFDCAAGEIGAPKAQAGAKLFGVRPLCDGMDDTRPNGAARGYAGMVG